MEKINILQKNLNNDLIKTYTKFRGFTYDLLNIFYLNKDIALSPMEVYESLIDKLQTHPNTIHNFIKSAINKGRLVKLKSKLYLKMNIPKKYVKYDGRRTFYKITQLGINVCELNFRGNNGKRTNQR